MGVLQSIMDLSIWEMVNAAGPVGWVLVFLAGICCLTLFYKLLVFSRAGLWGGGYLHQVSKLLSNGEVTQAVSLVKSRRHPAAQLIRLAEQRSRTEGLDPLVLESELEQSSLNAIDRLKSGFKIIGAVATLSPLLGLLGTVLGMIEAFRKMEAAGNQVDPSILSGGIWLALLTTAIGLIVAIPATAAHLWLNAVIARTTRQVEAAGTAILNGLKLRAKMQEGEPEGDYRFAAE